MPHTSRFFDLDRIRETTGVDLLHWEPETSSTNCLALEKAADWAAFDRVLVLTDRQTAGRGRGSNQWWSSDGALTLSLWLRVGDDRLLGNLAPCSLTIGNSVCEALGTFQGLSDPGQIGLKWPNDIWIDQKKLGGVLIEIPPNGCGAVIGIGVNINNSFAGAPNELRAIADSLHDRWRRELDLSDTAIEIVRELELQLNSLVHPQSTLPEQWRHRCVLAGRRVVFRIGQRLLQATCNGIDDDGALVLEVDGKTERFLAGSIEQVLGPTIS